MKNPKTPTRKQKEIMKSHGLNVESFLVVKNLPDSIEIVKASDLKKYKDKKCVNRIRTQILIREKPARA